MKPKKLKMPTNAAGPRRCVCIIKGYDHLYPVIVHREIGKVRKVVNENEDPLNPFKQYIKGMTRHNHWTISCYVMEKDWQGEDTPVAKSISLLLPRALTEKQALDLGELMLAPLTLLMDDKAKLRLTLEEIVGDYMKGQT